MSALSNGHPVVAQFLGLVSQLGQAALSQLYPNDFETYFCALELVDSRQRVVDFFVFPVMPSTMQETNTNLTTVKQTAGGVTVLGTTQYVPIDFRLQGNFGRKFKFLVGQQIVDASAISFSTQAGVFTARQGIEQGLNQTRNAVFNSEIKTGYGCYNILRAICNKSTGLDEDGNPYHLYFYNPTMNSAHMIEVISFVSAQDDKQSNMLHSYQIDIKLVAPLEGLKRDGSADSLTKTMQYGIINQTVDASIGNLSRSLRTAYNQATQ